MSKEQTKAFIDKIHFLHYNAYRVDMDIKLAYHKDAEGKETVLIWNHGDGVAVPKYFMDEAFKAIQSHRREYQYLLDCIKDLDQHGYIKPDTVVVIGLRNEAGSKGTLDSITERMWCCEYRFDENSITEYEPILDPFDQTLDDNFGPNGIQKS